MTLLQGRLLPIDGSGLAHLTDIKTLKNTGDEVQLEAKKAGKTVTLMVDARTGRYKESNS